VIRNRALSRGRCIRSKVAPSSGGRKDPLFLAGVENRHGTSLEAIKRVDCSVSRDPKQIEAEVICYFEALFQGKYALGTGNQTPVDSGSSFQPDFVGLDDFLCGFPNLSVSDSALLDLPINVPDLKRAMEAASIGRSLGLDGISCGVLQGNFQVGWARHG
jgi:hypothetical protein